MQLKPQVAKNMFFLITLTESGQKGKAAQNANLSNRKHPTQLFLLFVIFISFHFFLYVFEHSVNAGIITQ